MKGIRYTKHLLDHQQKKTWTTLKNTAPRHKLSSGSRSFIGLTSLSGRGGGGRGRRRRRRRRRREKDDDDDDMIN
jgi:hypothetical protein